MSKIFYIGYYDAPNYSLESRRHVLSAVNKMNYISCCLNACDYLVQFVSCSDSLNGFCGSKKLEIENNNQLILFSSFDSRFFILKLFNEFSILSRIKKYLSNNYEYGDKIVIYHSLKLTKIYDFLIQKFGINNIILEVEEIYSDVASFNRRIRTKEIMDLTKFEKYILPNRLLAKNEFFSKKSAICNGIYSCEEKHIFNQKKSDKRIHCVYSGTLAKNKGADFLLDVARKINKKYIIHVLGTGSFEDIKKYKEEVDKINLERGFIAITYNGILRGSDYIDFLSCCDIGLSPQNENAIFNETSFPSKILSYFSCGLNVLSINIKAIRESNFSDIINFYDKTTLNCFLDALYSFNYFPKEIIFGVLKKENCRFVSELLSLLKNE